MGMDQDILYQLGSHMSMLVDCIRNNYEEATNNAAISCKQLVKSAATDGQGRNLVQNL